MAEAETALVPAGPRPRRRGAPRAAARGPGPRPPARHRCSAAPPSSGRTAVDGRGRPDRPARRLPLPRQARHRERPHRPRRRRRRQGRTAARQARGRLDEVGELARSGSADPSAAVAATLDGFTSRPATASDMLLAAYAETGDEDDLRRCATFTDESMDRLGRAGPRRARAARDELVAAGRRLADDRPARPARLPGLRWRRGHPPPLPALRAGPGHVAHRRSTATRSSTAGAPSRRPSALRPRTPAASSELRPARAPARRPGGRARRPTGTTTPGLPGR